MMEGKQKTITWKEIESEDTQMSRAAMAAGRARCARQVVEGARGMPWLPEAKKDAAGCEKPRGGANGR